jgi:hypothetical protein
LIVSPFSFAYSAVTYPCVKKSMVTNEKVIMNDWRYD